MKPNFINCLTKFNVCICWIIFLFLLSGCDMQLPNIYEEQKQIDHAVLCPNQIIQKPATASSPSEFYIEPSIVKS